MDQYNNGGILASQPNLSFSTVHNQHQQKPQSILGQMFFSTLPCFPSHKGPFWLLSIPRIMSHARTGLGPSGWGGGGCPVAGPELQPMESFKWAWSSGVGMPYIGIKSLGTFWGTIIGTVLFLITGSTYFVFFNFNLQMLRVREVRFISHLCFLELKTVWRRGK